MLKNCFLPVIYNESTFQTCGEIVCKNLQEFIINCKVCKIKIFEYDEFISHFKNIHLEEDSIEIRSNNFLNHMQNHENEEIFNRVIKLEITEATVDQKDSTNENEEFILNIESHDEKDHEPYSEDEFQEDDEKSIMRKPRKPKELSCKICNKKYADSRRLKIHVKIVHLRENSFKCTLCDQAFAEERYLKNHVGHKHTSFDCPECHKNFSTNQNLKRHMVIHSEKEDFICPEKKCGKSFASKYRLRNHQRYHNGEMFICEECGYRCRKRDSLTVHKRHHTGEKPFCCNLCNSRFFSKPLLTEHMATHETDRKHICDVCGKSFNRPKALYHHKHLHLGVKKFVCTICGQAYAQAAGLSAHMRKHREDIASFATQ